MTCFILSSVKKNPNQTKTIKEFLFNWNSLLHVLSIPICVLRHCILWSVLFFLNGIYNRTRHRLSGGCFMRKVQCKWGRTRNKIRTFPLSWKRILRVGDQIHCVLISWVIYWSWREDTSLVEVINCRPTFFLPPTHFRVRILRKLLKKEHWGNVMNLHM